LAWSPDGQILTVSTSAGNIYNFLAKMSVLFTSYKSTIAYLSSLREISIIDGVKKTRPVDVTVKLEPSLIAVGGRHVAAGMNNRVYYHRIGSSENTPPVNEQEYIGIVKEVQLNSDFAVILTDSKAIIHPIEPSNNSQNQTKTFPNRDEGSYSRVTCVALTDNFFFYGTEAGTVEIFFLTEWTLLSGIELRLDNPIKKIYPNTNGTRIIVIDGANQVFLYNPVNGTSQGTQKAVTRFESTPNIISNVLWDLEEKNIVMLYDNNAIHTYIYIQISTEGSKLLKLGPVTVSNIGEIAMKPDKVDILSGNVPILSSNGVLTCQTSGGNISTIVHPFFDKMNAKSRLDRDSKSSKSSRFADDRDRTEKERDDKVEYERKMNYFCQCLALHKLEKAWELAIELDKRSFFLALSHKAMESLNVELACRVYNQLGDAGMVMALRKSQLIEDKNLLAGHISLLFCEYQHAQDLFLSSSRPITALEMRKDLMQWDQALKLAQVLSQQQIPEICIQYAQQLEARDEIDSALKMYEEALSALDNDGNRVCPDHLVPPAMMGIARCNLRLGNVRQGIRMANELDDKLLFTECGNILEIQKQYSEAASMFVKGLQYEKAALIYTKYLIKNDKGRISEATVIMEKVDNDALNSAFGKACVGAGRFEDALKAYTRANDYEKVIVPFSSLFFVNLHVSCY
jgi:WD repeat-containing protein 19